MVHVTDEVVPVWIVVDEAGSIDVKLEHGLETSVYMLKVLGVAFDPYDIECLNHSWLVFGVYRSIWLYWFYQDAQLGWFTLVDRHILRETKQLSAR